MHLCAICMQDHLELKLGSCHPPSGCWESNPSALDEPQVLLTTDPSLQPTSWEILIYCFTAFMSLVVMGILNHLILCLILVGHTYLETYQFLLNIPV